MWSGSVAIHVLPVMIANVVCGVLIWITSGKEKWKVSFLLQYRTKNQLMSNFIFSVIQQLSLFCCTVLELQMYHSVLYTVLTILSLLWLFLIPWSLSYPLS